MKRFISALALCVSLLLLLSVFLFPPAKAKENVLKALLDLPAPPPPNPLVPTERKRDAKFYDKTKPPADNAPTAELLDYWTTLSGQYTDLTYMPEPTDRVAARLMAEIEKDVKQLPNLLNALPRDERTGNFVKNIYDKEGANGAFDRDVRDTIKKWLTYNTAFFSNDLARIANGAGDSGEYVTNHDDILALTRVDFDKASPIIDRLAAISPERGSSVVAKWAKYRHALETNSSGDIARYREELKAVVEDKSATAGMRDLALDALAKEKDWPGREEWYVSLLGDETLADLKVNGSSYTGLTTLPRMLPDGKLNEKMLELAASDNKVIRAAAVRNLTLSLNTSDTAVIKALLPWLEDPSWAEDLGSSRASIVNRLAEIELPESVPGLIKMLDEAQQMRVFPATPASNTTANRSPGNYDFDFSSMGSNSNRVIRSANTNSSLRAGESYRTHYPFRDSAVSALAKQKDPRAVPALRRILPQEASYQQSNIIRALIACGGFSVAEQMDALELAAKGIRDQPDAGEPDMSNTNSPVLDHDYSSNTNYATPRPVTPESLRAHLSRELVNVSEISDDLARALVARIEALDTTDKPLAGGYRRLALKWQNAVINMMMLSDVKRDMADSETIVRLLAQRKTLREQQSSDISHIRTGTPFAVGIAACLFEDRADAEVILDGDNDEMKAALFACSRLIRLPLPVAKAEKQLSSTKPFLVTAAERYLESEDSPEARSAVLARHAGEARIMGATSAFYAEGAAETTSETLYLLYQSVGNDALYNGWYGSNNDGELKEWEKGLRDEVKKDTSLLGIYAYDKYYIRIYGDRVIFRWDEDESRYRERQLTKFEFDEMRAFIADNRLDEMPPFITCGGEYCEAVELLMLGRNGGRRVYINGGPFDLFVSLDKYFERLRAAPAALKYKLSSDIPGLEIVFASDALHAETVWKKGDDLRVAASDIAAREKIKGETEAASDSPDAGVEEVEKAAAAAEKRRYDGVNWFQITGGAAAGYAPQPDEVEFIPGVDRNGSRAPRGAWRSRAAGVAVRAGADGLYKIVGGRTVKLDDDSYSDAVITPDGRRAVVLQTNGEGRARVVRFDLATGKRSNVGVEGYTPSVPACFIPTLNKVLVVRNEYTYYAGRDEENEDIMPIDADNGWMNLVDPVTGAVLPTAGEFRPLAHQTFRPLQRTGRPNEFWAAIADPEKNETSVGIYDINNFGFKEVLRIPKIKFNSMSLWVDEPGRKAYFVYRGHLLSLPLP